MCSPSCIDCAARLRSRYRSDRRSSFSRLRNKSRPSPSRSAAGFSCRRAGFPRNRRAPAPPPVTAAHARAAKAMPGLIVRNANRVGECVGALRRRDRFGKRYFAVTIFAVSEQHERLAASLFAHQIVRCEINRIVKSRAAVASRSMTPVTAASSAAPIAAAILAVLIRLATLPIAPLRLLDLIERFFQFLARCRQVLQQLYFAIEVDQESLVFFRPQYLLEKLFARLALCSEHAALAHAGIDQ